MAFDRALWNSGDKGARRRFWPILWAAVIVVIFLVFLTPTRWFLAVSLPLGCMFAIALRLWHKCRPVKPQDFDDKHPLGLE